MSLKLSHSKLCGNKKTLSMKEFIIEETVDTPEVILDKTKNIFKLSGRSFPENAPQFYEPIMEWLENYLKSPNKKSVLELNFSYFNTSTSKQLLKMLDYIFKSDKTNIKVRWFYEKDDIDMLSTGKLFAQLLKTDFEIMAI